MPTKVATAISAGSAAEAAKAGIRAINKKLKGDQAKLVMAFASTEQPLSQLMPMLTQAYPDAVVLGASTAGEFIESGDTKANTAFFALSGDYKVFAGMGENLDQQPEAAVKSAVMGLPLKGDEDYPHRTGILLLDALAGRSEEATLMASVMLGGEIRLAGGAAGDDLKMESPEVALGDRVASKAIVAAVLLSKKPLAVGVCHGHSPISEPMRVTKAEGNVVHEIEGRPAWDVWAEATASAAAKIDLDPTKLSQDEIVGYLLRYEAGLATGNEYKIRAPLARDKNGALSFACGIPEGAVIRITESIPQAQIDSAIQAAKRARESLSAKPAGALVFDCICRNLILDKDFSTAIKGMSKELGGAPIAGFETYGEIALDAGDLSGFHNTTTVLLAFPE